MDNVTTTAQIDLLKERIPFNANIFGNYDTYLTALNKLLDDSKFIALSLRFPYQDYSNMALPLKYYNWQLRCCEEIYKSIGTVGIKSYAENGLSWTRDSGYISYELRGEIEPMAGYIFVEEDSESDTNV